MCERAFYPGKVIAIPVRWVQDGVPDCHNGEDEKGHWDRCGEGSTSRVRRNTSCTEVFYCTPKREIFTELSDLCQPQSECGYNLCPVSRRGLTVSSLIPFNEATSIRTMPQCMKGIDSIRNLASSTCDSVVFNHDFHNFFGRPPKQSSLLPLDSGLSFLIWYRFLQNATPVAHFTGLRSSGYYEHYRYNNILILHDILSFFRLHGTVKASRFQRSGELTKKIKVRVHTLQTVLVLLAATIATIPVVPWLNDWFVNGLTFENNVRIFLGIMDKNELHDVIRRYHGSRKIGKFDASHLSWDQILKITRKMFSEDYNPITEKRISFYGNDAVCSFKYFVKTDDPQLVFVWSVISLHCVCFITVALFHVLIGVIAGKSQIQSRNQRKANDLNIKVTLICITDFCCWMPFLICCILHTAEVLDMSPWYQVFSIIILPLNSVLNPLLYSDLVNRLLEFCRSDTGDAAPIQNANRNEIEMRDFTT
eukprot:sb/3464302/